MCEQATEDNKGAKELYMLMVLCLRQVVCEAIVKGGQEIVRLRVKSNTRAGVFGVL